MNKLFDNIEAAIARADADIARSLDYTQIAYYRIIDSEHRNALVATCTREAEAIRYVNQFPAFDAVPVTINGHAAMHGNTDW